MTGESVIRNIFAGFALALASVSWAPSFAHADEVKFSAEVDRQQISVDESVTLKMSVQSDNGQVSDPQYSAPGFDLLNQYNAVQTQSVYDDTTGRISVVNSFEVNKVLKPQRTGTFKISGIQVRVGGQVYRAPDLTIQVGSGGAGTPPPRGYGSGGVGLRGAGKRTSLPSVFARAEVDKNKIYKGEQVVVSYYIYQRVRAFNIEITKFPTLNGFLKEELEMPYLARKLEMEQVVMDGVAYQRALLVRYAAYPLQDGKLEIDPMEIRYNYYNQSGADEQDPFAGLFHQALPGNSRSELLKIDVEALPDQGKPASFTGGVGEFDVVSAVDKTEVHANEAMTLTVKVEGRGNVASLQEPKSKWPDSIELYDTKGTVKANKGVGQKTFEFLLIPRQPGPLDLPSLEFSFFDPKKGQYVTKGTEPIKIKVLDPLPGQQAYVPKSAASGASSTGSTPNTKVANEPRGLKLPGDTSTVSFQGLPMWRWIYWLSLTAFGIFILLVLRDLIFKARQTATERSALRAKQEAKSWGRLRSLAERMPNGMPWAEVITLYDAIAAQVFDAIDRVYAVGSRSYSREELKRMLVDDRAMPEAVWTRTAKILEFAELVRFAATAGAVSEITARADGAKWVNEAEQVTRLIERHATEAAIAT